MKSKVEIRPAVLIAPCILSPGLQAAKKKDVHWGYQFIELLMKYKIDMISLPCPESAFNGFQMGLKRNKHGINYYESLEGYDDHCKNLAIKSVNMIEDMQKGGYHFICIIGIEHSPTCAMNYMYSNHGTLKRKGIFTELLKEELEMRMIRIPNLGVNRTYPKKAIAFLEQMILNFGMQKDVEKGDEV